MPRYTRISVIPSPKNTPVSAPSLDAETGSLAPHQPERSLERALGQQIRLIRRQHDLSVADLAASAGISNGMLSKIENGGISPSLSTLQAISAALQLPLSSLFASYEERQDCSYVPAGQGLRIDRRGTKVGHIYHLLGHVLRGDVVVEPYLITLSENAAAHTSFRHSGIEFIYMLQGQLRYRHGSENYDLKPGDSLLFDSSALHGPEDISDAETRYLSIIIYPREPA
ncbi:MAG: helix-turn-helix transcriptional regulator [Sphingobium sp.]|nr:helix-turn-helix transcriptional regulator [Sphingobium sp.]MBP8671967.1 helix-turn-helix transcriptional regulator [Sphingobium sp.]MBP9158771.1 helix-turn-helix transcriptional regulator [Sphingobium sp.]MCC6482335.1 helix-turn-helix transcriptional regulator [Sphingomonadaceae bacterium]